PPTDSGRSSTLSLMTASRLNLIPPPRSASTRFSQARPKIRPCVFRAVPYTPRSTGPAQAPGPRRFLTAEGRGRRLARRPRPLGAEVVGAESSLLDSRERRLTAPPLYPRPGRDADPRRARLTTSSRSGPIPPPTEPRPEVDLDCARPDGSPPRSGRAAPGLVAVLLAARGPRAAVGAQRRRDHAHGRVFPRRAGRADDLGHDHRFPERH